MEPHLVSVLVPTYNAGELGVAAVRSALEQSYTNLEVLIVDDGSSDNTVERLSQINDPRIQIHSQANAGPAAACNTALRLARGTYIALLDHDDLWAPAKLALQIGVMDRNPTLDMTFTWSRLIDENGEPSGLCSNRWQGTLSFDQMVTDFVIGNTSSVVLRRDALVAVGEFDPSFRLYYDMDLFLRAANLRPANCASVPADLTFYRRHSTQISSDWRAMEAEWQRLMEKLRPHAPPMSLQRGNANMHRYFAFLAYERRSFGEALQLLAKCYRLCGAAGFADIRNWKLLLASLAGLLLAPSVHASLESLAGIHRKGDRKT